MTPESKAKVAVASPGESWRLIARRRFSADQVYNVGCEVEPAALGKNYAALLSARYVAWVPPGTVITAKPSPLPVPETPKPRPRSIEIVHASDVVESWRQTRACLLLTQSGHSAISLLPTSSRPA